MNYYFRVLISLVIALILEFGVFNGTAWLVRFDDSVKKDQLFEVGSDNDSNAAKEDDGFVSIGLEKEKVYSISVECPKKEEEACLIVYVSDSGETIEKAIDKNFKGDFMFSSFGTNMSDLTVKIGEDEKPVEQGTRITVNPSGFNISVSRIVAVVLIYICGSQLFRIQKMPDYSIYVASKEEKNDKDSQVQE